jgi:hypothetical protein
MNLKILKVLRRTVAKHLPLLDDKLKMEKSIRIIDQI